MKKIITITIFVLLILLIGISTHNKRVEEINKDNLKEFINNTFGKDSENRGFSDEIKKRIDSKIKDPELKKALYKQATLNKKAILAETEEEYLSYVLKTDQMTYCLGFLRRKYNIEFSLDDQILLEVDNRSDYQTMINAVEYVRFHGYKTTKKTIDNVNKKVIFIRTQEDYEKHCKGF